MLAGIRTRLIRVLKKEDGPTAVEYAVVFALFIGLCLSSIVLFTIPKPTIFSKGSFGIAAATAAS